MKTLKISRTVYPPFQFSCYNEWAQFFWGLYGKELDRVKNLKNWDRNTYTIKQK